jgi:trehalose 6-phosphate phosphatase
MSPRILPLRVHCQCIVATVAAAARTLICTDFDGTLVPLREDPGDCMLDAGMRTTLAAIHRPPRIQVAVVSGRRLADVRRRVGVEGITYAGNHGLEIEGDGLAFREPNAVACRPLVQAAAERLQPLLGGIEGARLEHKGLTLTVHYRRVRTEALPALRAAVAKLSPEMLGPGRLRLHGGKQVIELRPDVSWGKGQAVAWLGRRLACRGEHRVVIGDDETDEEAFAACDDGITIRIGAPGTPTAARYLAEAAELSAFFMMLRRALDARDTVRPTETGRGGRWSDGETCRGI